MTLSGTLVVFSGCMLFKRQKSIRTKEFIECSNDRSSKLDVHLFIQCDAPMVLCLRLLLLERNRRFGCSILFCSFKNVFYMVNTSLACCMNIQKYERSLLIDGLMHVHDLHSYVLLFLCLYSLFTPCLE